MKFQNKKIWNLAVCCTFNLIDIQFVKADKNMSDEDIKKELNKKFRMKGFSYI